MTAVSQQETYAVTRPAQATMAIDPRFTALAGKFFAMFKGPGQGGGALSVYLHGEPVLDIWAGESSPGKLWQADTLALSYSTSKGVAATVLHRLADRGLLDYDKPVAEYWPEFAANGKADITVRELLAHRAGLHRTRDLLPDTNDLSDHAKLAEALAAAAPDPRRLWGSGYHGLTFGTLAAEIAQRITGKVYADIVQEELAQPLAEDGFWFGVPEEQRHRVATLGPRIAVAGIPLESIGNFGRRLKMLDTVRSIYFDGWIDMSTEPQRPYEVVMPSWNGTFTARALGKLYGAIANKGEVDDRRFLGERTVGAITEMRNNGARRDYLSGVSAQWALGYHRLPYGGKLFSPKVIAHAGLGGSGGLAIPELGLSVGFVTSRLGGALTSAGDFRLSTLYMAASRAALANRLRQ